MLFSTHHLDVCIKRRVSKNMNKVTPHPLFFHMFGTGCYLLFFNNDQTHHSTEIRCLQVSRLSVPLTEKTKTGNCNLTCLHNHFCSHCKTKTLKEQIHPAWGEDISKTFSVQHLNNVSFSQSLNLFFSASVATHGFFFYDSTWKMWFCAYFCCWWSSRPSSEKLVCTVYWEDYWGSVKVQQSLWCSVNPQTAATKS